MHINYNRATYSYVIIWMFSFVAGSSWVLDIAAGCRSVWNPQMGEKNSLVPRGSAQEREIPNEVEVKVQATSSTTMIIHWCNNKQFYASYSVRIYPTYDPFQQQSWHLPSLLDTSRYGIEFQGMQPNSVYKVVFMATERPLYGKPLTVTTWSQTERRAQLVRAVFSFDPQGAGI